MAKERTINNIYQEVGTPEFTVINTMSGERIHLIGMTDIVNGVPTWWLGERHGLNVPIKGDVPIYVLEGFGELAF